MAEEDFFHFIREGKFLSLSNSCNPTMVIQITLQKIRAHLYNVPTKLTSNKFAWELVGFLSNVALLDDLTNRMGTNVSSLSLIVYGSPKNR
jgi:hypothetical protein